MYFKRTSEMLCVSLRIINTTYDMQSRIEERSLSKLKVLQRDVWKSICEQSFILLDTFDASTTFVTKIVYDLCLFLFFDFLRDFHVNRNQNHSRNSNYQEDRYWRDASTKKTHDISLALESSKLANNFNLLRCLLDMKHLHNHFCRLFEDQNNMQVQTSQSKELSSSKFFRIEYHTIVRETL